MLSIGLAAGVVPAADKRAARALKHGQPAHANRAHARKQHQVWEQTPPDFLEQGSARLCAAYGNSHIWRQDHWANHMGKGEYQLLSLPGALTEVHYFGCAATDEFKENAATFPDGSYIGAVGIKIDGVLFEVVAHDLRVVRGPNDVKKHAVDYAKDEAVGPYSVTGSTGTEITYEREKLSVEEMFALTAGVKKSESELFRWKISTSEGVHFRSHATKDAYKDVSSWVLDTHLEWPDDVHASPTGLCFEPCSESANLASGECGSAASCKPTTGDWGIGSIFTEETLDEMAERCPFSVPDLECPQHPPTAEKACAAKGVSLEDAKANCSTFSGMADETMFANCQFDHCFGLGVGNNEDFANLYYTGKGVPLQLQQGKEAPPEVDEAPAEEVPEGKGSSQQEGQQQQQQGEGEPPAPPSPHEPFPPGLPPFPPACEAYVLGDVHRRWPNELENGKADCWQWTTGEECHDHYKVNPDNSRSACEWDGVECYDSPVEISCAPPPPPGPPPHPAPSGEDLCEGHGYTEKQCASVGCCQFAKCPANDGTGKCHSNVGDGECTELPFATHKEDGPWCASGEAPSPPSPHNNHNGGGGGGNHNGGGGGHTTPTPKPTAEATPEPTPASTPKPTPEPTSPSPPSPSTGGITVGGDPIFHYLGEWYKVALPQRQEVPMLTWTGGRGRVFELMGKTYGRPGMSNTSQWFGHFTVKVDDKPMLAVSVCRIADVDCATSGLKTMRVILSDGVPMKTKDHKDNERGLVVHAKELSKRPLGYDHAERLTLTAGGTKLEISTQGARKFDSPFDQAQYSHLGLKVVEIPPSGRGMLKELALSSHLSEETKKYVVPTGHKADSKVEAKWDPKSQSLYAEYARNAP